VTLSGIYSMDRSSEWCGARPTRRNRPRSRGPNGQPVDAPGHIADVTSHLAIPNSGVRRYAAALQSLVSAGVRDRLARAVRRLCARGRWIRTIGPRHERAGFCCGRRIAEPNGGSQKGLFLIRYRWFESISLQRRATNCTGGGLRWSPAAIHAPIGTRTATAAAVTAIVSGAADPRKARFPTTPALAGGRRGCFAL
jgi:hypothetical protein